MRLLAIYEILNNLIRPSFSSSFPFLSIILQQIKLGFVWKFQFEISN